MHVHVMGTRVSAVYVNVHAASVTYRTSPSFVHFSASPAPRYCVPFRPASSLARIYNLLCEFFFALVSRVVWLHVRVLNSKTVALWARKIDGL